MASSAWRQLILFRLPNCGQKCFQLFSVISPKGWIRSSPKPAEEPAHCPSSRVEFGEMSGKFLAWQAVVLMQDLKNHTASCHLSLGTNCKIDCCSAGWLQGKLASGKWELRLGEWAVRSGVGVGYKLCWLGQKFSLVLIKSQTAFPCCTLRGSGPCVLRGFVNELARQNRIKNTSKLMTLCPGEKELE